MAASAEGKEHPGACRSDCKSTGLRPGFERRRSLLRHWIGTNVRSSLSLKVDFESSLALLLLYAGAGYFVGTAILEGL